MQKVILNTRSYGQIKQMATDISNAPEMSGARLQALYKLIQKKGEPIQTDDKLLNGVYCLQISKTEYIAIIRTGSNKSFFPCSIKTILLNH